MFLQEQSPYYSISLTEDPLLSLNVDFIIGEKEKYKKIVENSVRTLLKNAVNNILVEPNGKVFPLNVNPPFFFFFPFQCLSLSHQI
jgi:hypothetical protein